MSNPDVPSLEACKRLNWPVPENIKTYTMWWCEVPGYEPHLEYMCVLGLNETGSAVKGVPCMRAPTIGELLAEIRRRGRDFAEGVGLLVLRNGRTTVDKMGTQWGLILDAETIATALAEAIEEEKK